MKCWPQAGCVHCHILPVVGMENETHRSTRLCRSARLKVHVVISSCARLVPFVTEPEALSTTLLPDTEVIQVHFFFWCVLCTQRITDAVHDLHFLWMLVF